MRELLVEQHAGLVHRFQLRLRGTGQGLSTLCQVASAPNHAAAPAAASTNRAALIDCLVVIRNAKFEVHGTSIH
jgi:hypothetical protein